MTKIYWNINLKEMIEVRVYLGNNKKRWNSRITYIHAKEKYKRKTIHIHSITNTYSKKRGTYDQTSY
jgi:ribosomal protein S2